MLANTRDMDLNFYSQQTEKMLFIGG